MATKSITQRLQKLHSTTQILGKEFEQSLNDQFDNFLHQANSNQDIVVHRLNDLDRRISVLELRRGSSGSQRWEETDERDGAPFVRNDQASIAHAPPRLPEVRPSQSNRVQQNAKEPNEHGCSREPTSTNVQDVEEVPTELSSTFAVPAGNSSNIIEPPITPGQTPSSNVTGEPRCDSGQTEKERTQIIKFRAMEKRGVKNHDFRYSASGYEESKLSRHVRDQMYEFQDSAWDAGMISFLPWISKGNSAVVLLMFFMNAVLQNFLMLAIFMNFTLKDIDDDYIAGLRRWRITVAHDARWMDGITRQSLARSVCNEGGASGGLYMSGNVQDTLAEVLQYRPDMDFLSPAKGVMATVVKLRPPWIGTFLSVICLMIWWTTCYIELKSWLDCTEGIFLVPRGPTTRLVLVDGDEDVALSRMSRHRKLWCGFVLLNRLVVALSLLVVGTLYLLYTLDLRDLILNAVALELVLNLDELLYTAFVPFHVRHFMYCLEPIPKVMGRCFTGKCDYEITVVICCFGIGSIVAISYLKDQDDKLCLARRELCEGYLDFVYTVDPGGALVAMPTNAPAPGHAYPPVGDRRITGFVDESESNYRWEAVKELIDDWRAIDRNPEHSLSDTAAALFGSRLGLLERPMMLIGERMGELNPKCDDLNISTSNMVWPSSFIAKIISSDLANFGIPVSDSLCLQGRRMCNWDNETGTIFRQWCPRSCGCDLPNSSLILARNNQGCPNSCATGKLYKEKLGVALCEDHSVSSPEFQEYIAGFREVKESYVQNADWTSKLTHWIQNLSTHGCAAHGIDIFGDLCGSTAWGLKPLHYICPITCNCSQAPSFGLDNLPAGQSELCPYTCVNWTTDHYHQPPDVTWHIR